MQTIRIILFASWLTAGASIDQIFDDWRAAVIFAVAIIVTVASAAVLASGNK